ncbi:MAG: hypothetical protein L0Y39_03775 [Methylococcaceae bacterium]|nr:hypothetical protein [Methylococcaceae bacterium]
MSERDLVEISADELASIRATIREVTQLAETREWQKFPFSGLGLLNSTKIVTVPKDLLLAAKDYYDAIYRHIENLSTLPDLPHAPLNFGLFGQLQKRGRGRPKKTKSIGHVGKLSGLFEEKTNPKKGGRKPRNLEDDQFLVDYVEEAKRRYDKRTDKAALIEIIKRFRQPQRKHTFVAEKEVRRYQVRLSKIRKRLNEPGNT